MAKAKLNAVSMLQSCGFEVSIGTEDWFHENPEISAHMYGYVSELIHSNPNTIMLEGGKCLTPNESDPNVLTVLPRATNFIQHILDPFSDYDSQDIPFIRTPITKGLYSSKLTVSEYKDMKKEYEKYRSKQGLDTHINMEEVHTIPTDFLPLRANTAFTELYKVQFNFSYEQKDGIRSSEYFEFLFGWVDNNYIYLGEFLNDKTGNHFKFLKSYNFESMLVILALDLFFLTHNKYNSKNVIDLTSNITQAYQDIMKKFKLPKKLQKILPICCPMYTSKSNHVVNKKRRNI